MQAPDALIDVAVIGAGAAGLAAALGLSQQGLKVALIGPPTRRFIPSDNLPYDVRIYALAPATIDLLARLKVWPQIDGRRVQPVSRMRVFGDDGDELGFDAYGARVERLATIGEEGELLRVLTTGVAFAPGVARHEVGLRTLRVEPKAAMLELDDGTRLRCALVVGADGAQSQVRTAAGLSAEVVPYPHTAVVANFAAAKPHDGVAWQWFCDEGVVALLPLPGNAISLVWSAPHALAAQLLALTPVELANRVALRSQQAHGEL